MAKLHIALGNKLYSSWSLRPWFLMTALGIEFDETVIAMHRPETKSEMLKFSPIGKVPVINDDGIKVWESLAIIEYLAERFPDKAVWPRDRAARAHARAISNEMHAGFQALRNACPMNLGKRFAKQDLGDAVMADVARIEAVWAEARVHFGTADEPFLYGAFSAADAMYAPVVTRLDTYQIPVKAETRAYMDAVLGHSAYKAWLKAALAEPWHVAHYEEGHVMAETYHHPKAA
jgi:glutathione S-transferase